MTPEVWADRIVKNLGPEKAARIAQIESREFIGVDTKTVNQNRDFFLTAFNWIKRRFPNCLEKESQ